MIKGLNLECESCLFTVHALHLTVIIFLSSY